MIEKVLKTIKDKNLIEENDHVIVGVSGGPDSISVLHILNELKKELNIELTVVHINHCLRGKLADDDEAYTKDFCEKLNIPCYTFKKNIKKLSKKSTKSEEEIGREERYKAFREIKKKVKANKIAVAQNLNDQGETVLFRLIRGSGLDGLAAINYKRDDIIRPLLDITRSEIEEYCQANDLKPRTDHTNNEAIYTRNKIRLELLPYIKEHFNGNIEQTLWQTAKVLNEDKQFIQDYMSQYDQDIIVSNQMATIKKEIFDSMHIAIQKRMILYIADKIDQRKDIGAIHITNVINLINEDNTSKGIDLPNGLRIRIGYDDIIFENTQAQNEEELFVYTLPIEETTEIPEINAKIHLRIVEKGIHEIPNRNDIKMFNYDLIDKKLLVRTRREGDLFQPIGMKGTKKLKNFLIDEKIPKEKRAQIPLLCSGKDIIWVVGYRMSEKYKVTIETKKILIAEFDQNEV